MGVGFQPVQPSTAILFWRTSPGLFQTRPNECIWWSHWFFFLSKYKQNIDFSLKPLLVSLVLQQNQTRKNNCFKQKTNILAILLVDGEFTWPELKGESWPPTFGDTKVTAWITWLSAKRLVESWAPQRAATKNGTPCQGQGSPSMEPSGKTKFTGWNRSVSSNLQNSPGWKWMKYD